MIDSYSISISLANLFARSRIARGHRLIIPEDSERIRLRKAPNFAFQFFERETIGVWPEAQSSFPEIAALVQYR
jgi:hypothetical protein